MVLKSDDNSGELWQASDASEDSSSTLLASEWRRGQKGLGLDKGGSPINGRANDVKEVFCSGADKNDKNKSYVSNLRKNLEQGSEVVDSRTSLGSLASGNDMEDDHRESMKQKLSVPSSYKSHDQTEKVVGSNILSKSDEMDECSLQTSPGDDVNEPDVEEDVKVCDICGDAGREDLLAVCSRCTDGAEHTYCMREMLDEVPEGDWLCEECKYNEALDARRQEHLKLLGTERSKSLGRTSSVSSDVSSKLDSKDSFNERSKLKTVGLSKQLPLKRSGDNIEAVPTAKKQVIELRTGSPTALSPSQVPVLSRDCSFKDSDKTKGKPANQFSAGLDSGGDSSENALSPTRNSKGNLMKSNSFSSSKANKGSEELVQKQKLVVDVKDGLGKFVGKSMSFKALGRSIVGEPKVKMLSPKCTAVQELKGQKQIKDRNSYERKNSIKLDNSFSFQTTANSIKHLSRNDSMSSVSNSSDYRNAQSDGKFTSLSKQTSNASHKSPDALTSLGEVKRLSSTNIRGSGTSSLAEAKPSHIISKEGSTFHSSRAFDGSYGGANATKADLHDNQSEKIVENAFIRSRQGANGAKVGGNRRGFSLDVSTLRAKDGVHEENKLKAAIEAAMQKKQNIVKKNKVPEKLSELSVSNSQGNYVVDAVSDQVTNFKSEEAVHARDSGIFNQKLNSCKHILNRSAKQFKTVDFVSSSEEDKYTMSAIPEQEAVWQGGFEIHRNGKRPDICGGFQAHLSSSASGKVLEVVRKLPQKIVFNEVSRSCVWPFQFKEASAREDNVAIYFFAKDLESYLRSYKILLEYMMKHDLALRGNINGVELLIFPSNHLAHRLQRWNTLFFMWGVFRGRKARCPDEGCPLERPEIAVVSNTVPRIDDNSSAACLSKNTSLQRPAVEDSSLSGNDTAASRCGAPVIDSSFLQKSGPLVNGDCYNEGCSIGETDLTSPSSQVNLEKGSEKYSSVLIAETRSESGTAAVEDHSQLDLKAVQLQCSSQDGDSGDNLQHESKKPLSNDLVAELDISSHSSKWTKLHLVVTQEDFSSDNTENNNADGKSDKKFEQGDRRKDNIKKNGGQEILDNIEDQILENKNSTWKNDIIEAKEENRLKQEGYVDINVSAECSMEDLHSLQCSPKRHSDDDSVVLASEDTSVAISQKRPWMDQIKLSECNYQAFISKSIKRIDDLYGREIQSVSSSFGDGPDTQIHDASTSSCVNDRSNEAVDEKLKPSNPGSAERCFFLGGSHAAQSVHSEDRSAPWKVSLLGNENRLPVGSPDLELALGAEKKRARKGVLPFFAGIVDREDPDRPLDMASSKAKDEDASASLSLSLAFPFSV